MPELAPALRPAEAAGEVHGFRFQALGGAGRIRLARCSQAEAARAVADGVRWLREAEARLSRFRPQSLVSRLNRDGSCPADPDLLSLLAVGERAHARTGGRFNLAATPLWQLWHDPTRETWPGDCERETARARCEARGITHDSVTVRLRPGMAIDLGGIAKEWCVDRLVTRLLSAGRCDFVVELAGDVAARGNQPGHDGWWILLPDRRHAFPLREAALATSGHHRRGRGLAGRRVSHLIDAATGLPASGAIVTATVLADTCTEAGLRATDAALADTPAEAWRRIGAHEAFLQCEHHPALATRAFLESRAEVAALPA